MAKSPTSLKPKFSSLIPSLSHLIDRVGKGELRISLAVTDAQEVIDLRDQILALNEELAVMRERNRVLEYDYRCEVIVNMELQDLLRANGIKIRRPLDGRHRKD